jgi:hypothetical protein
VQVLFNCSQLVSGWWGLGQWSLDFATGLSSHGFSFKCCYLSP